MASEQFSLCWDNFHRNMSSGMNSLLENEDLVDVTLAVEGRYLKAHKMVLSVCSPYFKELFKTNPCQHPIVFMKDVSYVALSDLLQFMYQGEVQVSQENLSTFIKTAEALQIKGLTGDGSGPNDNDVDHQKPVSSIVSDYKSSVTSPTPSRSKKTSINPSYSAPLPKRQRISTGPSSVSSDVISSPITKTEPCESKTTGDVVQFKMEPYDSSQTIKISDIDDTFEEGFEETGGDDTEDPDYTMMEGGDEEPQAGTSTEGTGEGQVKIKKQPKYKQLSLIKKLKIIDMVEKGEMKSKIAAAFNVSGATVTRVYQYKDKYRRPSPSKQKILENRTRLDAGKHKELEDLLYAWMKEMQSLGIVLSGPILQKKALFFNEQLKGPVTFKASPGWLQNFRNRHGIRLFNVQDEYLTDEIKAPEMKKELTKVFDVGQILDNLYSVGETDLEVKFLPQKTLALAEEKKAPD